MKVQEVMIPNVTIVGPDATLAEAAQLMREECVGPLTVCESGHVFGMVTDFDLTVRPSVEGRDPRATRVRDVVTPDIVCCFETDELDEARRLMRESRLPGLLVIDDDRRLVGTVSLADIDLQARAYTAQRGSLERSH
jgi:CBS domain-containing protein